MDSLLLRIITLSMALIALHFIDDGLGVDALHAQQSQATALGRRSAGQRIAAAVASLTPFAVVPRPEGVNKPELLPTTLVDGRRPNVIDVKVNFLTKGEQKRLDVLAAKTEKASGFKIRVLCQSYPETPGLAIKDYWKVDDKTVVLIADKGLKGTSNILNFNVGDGLADVLPTPFWTRLQGRFGTSRYWRDKGEDVAITNAVEAIAYCLQQEDGCTDPPSRDLIDAKL
ncbi:hypothetical protein JL721_2346 [Aureococcus anophagefferens]|nr:hypothetical protein JL721_2346 [Aureococcus anophagefferens]